MKRVPMTTYEEARAAFRWEIPDHFNFGGDVVDRYAEDPDRLALVWCDASGRERRFTYADVARLSNRFANVLRAGGVARGDRVVVCLPRLPAWQIAMVGCLKLGAVPVPCIEMLTAKDIEYRVRHSGAVAAVTTAANVGKFPSGGTLRLRLAVGGAEGWRDFDEALAAASDAFDPVPVAAEEPAALYYTSGSSGEPKGVTMAARGLFAWRVSGWYWQAFTEDDLVWCTADTGWAKAGTGILFGPWSCGSAVLFYDGPFDARRRFELMARYGVTVFCGPATEIRRLVDQDVSDLDLSALRLAVSAGETVNPELVERWRRLTGTQLLDGYGQTETLMTVLNYPTMPVKPGSMGRPCPGTDIAVLDDRRRPLGPGETGTLAIRLPNPGMMLGYWRDPERTAESIATVDGVEYFLTGDLARMDEDGYVFYEGRADDLINSAGYRIGPMEVENALMSHPAVRECAAVASPDPERGEVVKAFVVLRPGHAGSDALARELQEHVKRTTAPYKYPRRIAFVPDLPKSAVGKLQRRVLREREFAAARGEAAAGAAPGAPAEPAGGGR